MAEENSSTDNGAPTPITEPTTATATTTSTPTNPDTSALGGEGDAGSDDSKWYDALPEELRGNERITGFGSMEEALRAFADAPLQQPPPDEYELPQDFPKEFGQWAKQHGFSQAQVTEMLELQGRIQQNVFDATQQQYSEGLQHLYGEWGDRKNENLYLARQTIRMADPDGKLGLIDYLNSPQSGLAGNNPLLLRALHNLGAIFQEGGYIKSAKVDEPAPADRAHRLYPNDVPKG